VLRDVECSYALYPHVGTATGDDELQSVAEAVRNPLLIAERTAQEAESDPDRGAQDDQQSGPEAETAALRRLLDLRGEGGQVVLSAFKPTEDGQGLILRLWNPGLEPTVAELHPSFPLAAGWVSDLRERRGDRLPLGPSGKVRMTIEGRRIETLRLEPDAGDTSPAAADGPWWWALSDPVSATERETCVARFSRFSCAPLVTPEDIRAEELRLEELRARHAELQDEARAAKPGGTDHAPGAGETRSGGDGSREESGSEGSASPARGAAAQRLRSQRSTVERAILETRLSLAMLRKKRRQYEQGKALPEPDSAEQEAFFREVGLELNHARVRKRADDYLLAFWEAFPEE
jgi:hypothetical protein